MFSLRKSAPGAFAFWEVLNTEKALHSHAALV
jgi:hypothetical protein